MEIEPATFGLLVQKNQTPEFIIKTTTSADMSDLLE